MATALVETGVQFPGGTIQTSAIDSGIIAMWSGAIGEIPTGWFLCDGTNGTPDLRDKFVVNVGTTYSYQDTGGSANAVLVDHTHTTSAVTSTHSAHDHNLSHTHTGRSSPAGTHTHPFRWDVEFNANHNHPVQNVPEPSRLSSPAGDHTHTLYQEAQGVHYHTYQLSGGAPNPAATYEGGHRHLVNFGSSPVRNYNYDDYAELLDIKTTPFVGGGLTDFQAPEGFAGSYAHHGHYGYSDPGGSHPHTIPTENRAQADYFGVGPTPVQHLHYTPNASVFITQEGTHNHSGLVVGAIVGLPLEQDSGTVHPHSWAFNPANPADPSYPSSVGINPATINNDMQPAGSHSHPGTVFPTE